MEIESERCLCGANINLYEKSSDCKKCYERLVQDFLTTECPVGHVSEGATLKIIQTKLLDSKGIVRYWRLHCKYCDITFSKESYVEVLRKRLENESSILKETQEELNIEKENVLNMPVFGMLGD